MMMMKYAVNNNCPTTRATQYYSTKCGWLVAILIILSVYLICLSPGVSLLELVTTVAKHHGAMVGADDVDPNPKVEIPLPSRREYLEPQTEVTTTAATKVVGIQHTTSNMPSGSPTAPTRTPDESRVSLMPSIPDSSSIVLNLRGTLPSAQSSRDAFGAPAAATTPERDEQGFPLLRDTEQSSSTALLPSAKETANDSSVVAKNETTTAALPSAGLVSGPVGANTPLEDYSSVDYFPCCGLGHRLTFMSTAYHVAKGLKFELRTFWGWCEDPPKQTTPGTTNSSSSSSSSSTTMVEIYSRLFDPPSKEELSYVNSTHQKVNLFNSISGYTRFVRTTGSTECGCHEDKIATDFEFYASLRHRFKRRDEVQKFVQTQFAGKLALGIHVRAGNGETGDFKKKMRQIDNANVWVEHVVANIRNLVQQNNKTRNASNNAKTAVLFMATDTPSYIDSFRAALADIMPVVIWEQDRAPEGAGVFFGEATVPIDPHECLTRWEDTVMDQMILSHTDVIIAGRPSSFTQTLPLSLAFDRNEIKKVETPYCEVRGDHGELLECFHSYLHWCCNDKTVLLLQFMEPGPDRREIDVRMRGDYVKLRCRPHESKDKPIHTYCLPHDYEATRPSI